MRRHEDLSDPAAPTLRFEQADRERMAELNRIAQRERQTKPVKLPKYKRAPDSHRGAVVTVEGDWLAELRAESIRQQRSMSQLAQWAWVVSRKARQIAGKVPPCDERTEALPPPPRNATRGV